MKAVATYDILNNWSVIIRDENEHPLIVMDNIYYEKDAKTLEDKFNSALASHVESELSKTNAGYWKRMYELGRTILHQINRGYAYEDIPETKELESLESQPEPPSELSAKIEKIKAELSDEWIKDNPVNNKDWKYGAEWMRNEILNRLK